MPAPFLLIDGYNLMHAVGMARRRYGPGDLQRCREWFVRHVARRLSGVERRRATIVFDAGDAPPGVPREQMVEEMTVLFAPRGGDADSLIEELIAAHSAPRQIRLVSGDRRLQKAARRRRAKVVDSDRFAVELQQRGAVDTVEPPPGAAQPAHPKYTGRVSEAETQRWLEVFGELPDAGGATDEDELRHWQSRIDELEDEPE